MDDFLKRKLESATHPCGTCRMGKYGAAVTGPERRVRGIDALVMPQTTACDQNAPTLALAEPMSDLNRGRHLLQTRDAPLLAAEDWAVRQRSAVITRTDAGNRGVWRAAL